MKNTPVSRLKLLAAAALAVVAGAATAQDKPSS